MAENLGKKFEELIKEAFERECYILRLYDTTNGFLNVNNPCDLCYNIFIEVILCIKFINIRVQTVKCI